MPETRKFSKKREALLKALRDTKEHPSAEMLYSGLKNDYPDLSLGTVYRNLSMFVRDGDAISVGVVDGQERYDGCVTPHAHFVCRVCSRVLDAPMPSLGSLTAELEGELGVEVESVALSFNGLCPSCKNCVQTAN